MKLFTSAAVSIIFPFLASCAQKWDASQKAALSSVAVPAPAIAGDAYKKPVGKLSPAGPVPVVTPVGGGAAAGAVGGALGQLVIEGIGAVQQSMYEKKNADAISKASGTVPGNLSDRIRKAVAKELDANSFFKGKVREDSFNRVVVKVDSYGYFGTSKFQGKLHMAPQITGTCELIDAGGKSILRQPLNGVAAETRRPLEDFANDSKLAAAAFDEAIASLAIQISEAIGRKAN